MPVRKRLVDEIWIRLPQAPKYAISNWMRLMYLPTQRIKKVVKQGDYYVGRIKVNYKDTRVNISKEYRLLVMALSHDVPYSKLKGI